MTARRDRLAEIIVEMHGPAATHNMPCAVCRDRHAVLDLTTGIMQPCWQCQDRGYRVRFSWWRWMPVPDFPKDKAAIDAAGNTNKENA